jgi:hypothetical protein
MWMRKHCNATCSKLFANPLPEYGGEFGRGSNAAKQAVTKAMSLTSSSYLECQKGAKTEHCLADHFQNARIPPVLGAVLDAVDQVYVLCIHCEKFQTNVLSKWPQAMRSKVKLWNGKTMSDDKRCAGSLPLPHTTIFNSAAAGAVTSMQFCCRRNMHVFAAY